MDLTLLVLAAGMGSRYGGIKQLDRLGPSGETIMDYSIYDAKKAGFNKVVFVIRNGFADEFERDVVEKLRGYIDVSLVFQELNYVPEGIPYHPERVKPWGTAHAMLMAKDAITGPFAVINADDFYGYESYALMADFLRSRSGSQDMEFAMCGYRLENTLSEHGSVSRGICQVDADGYLQTVAEHTAIMRNADGIIVSEMGEEKHTLLPRDVVSMNFWGFSPGIFEHNQRLFASFLSARGQELKSEMYIPGLVDELIKADIARVKVLNSSAKWFGVTYADDKPKAMESIRALVSRGVYPDRLW